MRLDAARLKGCFGSCFRQKLLPEVPRCSTTKGFEEPASRRVFRFWRSLYRPVDPGSSPLILKTWNFFALKPFSGQIAPFSRSKKPPRETVPKGRIEQRGATEGFGGVAPLNKAHRAPRPRSGKEVSV